MDYNIRKMKKRDCTDVAHVITIAWNETYKGIVPDEFLNNLYKTEDARAKNSMDKFNENKNHKYVLEINNEIVGFVDVCLSDEESYENCGEIKALYILGSHKGKGYGKKLINAGIKELKNMNCDKMIISCLCGNKSNEFYKHIGGKFIKTRTFKLLNLPENVYLFEQI